MSLKSLMSKLVVSTLLVLFGAILAALSSPTVSVWTYVIIAIVIAALIFGYLYLRKVSKTQNTDTMSAKSVLPDILR